MAQLTDEHVIEKIKALRGSNNADWWDEMPESLQNDLDAAIAEADRGAGRPFDEVMEEMRKKYLRS